MLDGIRVLDFTRYIAGPYCAALLAHLGADVIRVDRPDGSEDRYVTPVAPTAGAAFMQTACNKRGLTLDLGHPAARAIVRALVVKADIVVANLPLPALARAGLDYASLAAIKPDIILTTVTAFGSSGPWAARSGFDAVGQAMSGAMYLSGTAQGPGKAAAHYVDFATGALMALGTLSALWRRRDSGEGQHVEASLLGTALAVFNTQLIEQGVLAIDRRPSGNRSQTSAPSDVFATHDGHVAMHIVGNALFRRLAATIGAPEWGGDPRFANDSGRGDHRDEICARVAGWCANRSTAEVLEQLAAADVPCAPVLDLQQALDHPQTAALGLLHAIDYPGLVRPAPVAGLPLTLAGAKPDLSRPPLPGEHTDEVLREAGFTELEIARFRADGAL